MDRSLDEVISERKNGNHKGGNSRRQNNWARNDTRKSNARDDNNIDTDWLHDKYQDDDTSSRPSHTTKSRGRNESGDTMAEAQGARLRVDNVHYEISEDDLQDLFCRISTPLSVTIKYDRAGRSQGTAFVTLPTIADARSAIREFDGANANGQPIRLALVASGPSNPAPARRNPFDTAIKPGRSLFERVEERRDRSRSPRRERSRGVGERKEELRSKVPDGVDRYVPSEDGRRRGGGRVVRDGDRDRDRSRRNERDGGRERIGRDRATPQVRKTQEELDREMEDYWSVSNKPAEPSTAAFAGLTEAPIVPTATVADGGFGKITEFGTMAAAAPVDEDIDMAI